MPASREWREKNKERVNLQRRLTRERLNQKVAKEQEDSKLAEMRKMTPDGKRVCLYDNCKTILSRYNEDLCCAQHQKDWFIVNKHQLKELGLNV